jgi:hypothetical protein
MSESSDVSITRLDDHVHVVTMQRLPNNYFEAMARSGGTGAPARRPARFGGSWGRPDRAGATLAEDALGQHQGRYVVALQRAARRPD